MTCIVGLRDDKNNKVWLGGDSLGTNGYSKVRLSHPKVFRGRDVPGLTIGISGAIALLNLEFMNLVDELDYIKDRANGEKSITREYLSTYTMPVIRQIAMEHNFSFSDGDNINRIEGEMLIAYQDDLYVVQSDYSIFQTMDEYHAIGCGAEYAIGSLHTTANTDIEPLERVRLALMAAAYHSPGVGAPFSIITTDPSDEEVKIIEK